MFDPPLFTIELADIFRNAQLDPIENITLRTLAVASRPNPLIIIRVDEPSIPANTDRGENPVTLPTNNKPLPALTKVEVFAAK